MHRISLPFSHFAVVVVDVAVVDPAASGTAATAPMLLLLYLFSSLVLISNKRQNVDCK